jgi:hypothetical protein
MDLSSSRNGIRLACLPAADAGPKQVRNQVRDVYGVWVAVAIRLRRPLATTIKQWVTRNRDEDIAGSLAALEQAVSPHQGR